MARETLARFNVVAAYSDMQHARKAIDALQFSGIEVRDISLTGEGAHRAAEAANSAINTTERDRPMLWRIITRAIVWGVVAAGIGALLGLLLSAIGLQFPRAVDSPALQIGSWALFGAIVGTLWGAYSGVSGGEAWELTFQPDRGGRVLVEVHSDKQEEIARAEQILREKDALTVAQVDEQGRPRL